MRPTALSIIGLSAFLSLAPLGSTGCTPSPPPPKSERTSNVMTQPGVPGGTVVQTHSVTANVTRVDKDGRDVTLALPGDETTTIHCGPEIANFDQIRVGDQLKATVAEEVAVYMATDAPTSPASVSMAVTVAPKGDKPKAVMTKTVQVTATVAAIDLATHKATLVFPDGKRKTLAVRDDVDLTKRQVGEKIVMRLTQSVAVSVEQP